MKNLVKGFAISGYKSFGETQYIHPLNKINLFVGQNNSGKSNILRFVIALGEVEKQKSKPGASPFIESSHLNRFQGALNTPMTFGLPLDLSESGINNIVNELLASKGSDIQQQRYLRDLLEEIKKEIGSDTWWFIYSMHGLELKSPTLEFFTISNQPKFVSSNVWQNIWQSLSGAGGGGLTQHWIPETLRALNPLRSFSTSPIFKINEQRKIGAAGTQLSDFNGDGLIDRLAELERPSYEKQDLKADFEKLNSFVKEVIENDTARLEIPADRSTINVSVNGLLLPIESLGSGIHQVIILGAAATTISDSIVCIEEPEVHLHPQLQRKLLNYLSKETSNQYFITTHSAHMLDAKSATVFHVRLENGQSMVTLANSPTKRHSICDDLGYRASDIMQSPCIIWVEGPSDRIYLRHWITQLEPLLEEDIHYSIMFYGGRLLSHLSPSDPDVGDFISLKRLNRNLVILIDSDKHYAKAPINDTKKRVVAALGEQDGFAWVTAGREIENYVEPNELLAAMKLVAPKFDRLAGTEKFDKPLDFYSKGGKLVQNNVDKVKLAKEICQKTVNLNQLDLSIQVTKLISYIKKANHI